MAQVEPDEQVGTDREVEAADVRWLTPQQLQAWQTLLSTTTSLLAVLDRELQAEHELSLAEYEVLVVVSERGPEGLRMQDLAGGLRLSPSGATRRVDGMVRRGFVARRQCPTDRRGSYVVLTDAGRAKLETAAPTHVRGVRQYFIDRLSERQLANVANALGLVEIRPEDAAGGCDEAG